MKFILREAQIEDISQIQAIRHSVKENTLSNPSLVTDEDCKTYILYRGKGWACEKYHLVIGFAIADLQDNNIWALFVRPEYEQMGIGKQLHHLMLDWYFINTKEKVWLTTWPGTRAETFYIKQSWKKVGILRNGEVKMEMTAVAWLLRC